MRDMPVGLGLMEGSRVHILDGKTEIGAHVRRYLCFLICYMHLIRSRAIKFLFPKDLFPSLLAQHVRSYYQI